MDSIEFLNMIVSLSNSDRPFSIRPSEYGYTMSLGDINYYFTHFSPAMLIEALTHFKAHVGMREGWIALPKKVPDETL